MKCHPARMKKDEQALQDLVLGWMISLPFDENALKEGENSLTSVFFESKDKKKIKSCYYTH